MDKVAAVDESRTMRRLPAVLLALCLVATPATAGEDEGTVVQSLVVNALDHGPAWWKVEHGESIVLIMGAPMGPLPDKLKWDHSVLQKRMKGAKALILPASPEWNLGTLFQLWGLRKKVRADGPMEPQLLPGDYARFKAIAERIDKPMSQFERFDPPLAALQLYGQFMNHYDLSGRDSTDRAAQGYARRLDVPIQRGRFKLGDAIKTAVSDANDKANSATCVHDVLEGLDQEPAKFRAAADGWASGDVARAIDLSDGPSRCWLTLFEGSAKVSMDSEMAAIDQALQSPGKAIALVPLRQLVIKGGVIEQLRAKGYTVLDPATRQGVD
jgi:hypothetical protein